MRASYNHYHVYDPAGCDQIFWQGYAARFRTSQ